MIRLCDHGEESSAVGWLSSQRGGCGAVLPSLGQFKSGSQSRWGMNDMGIAVVMDSEEGLKLHTWTTGIKE